MSPLPLSSNERPQPPAAPKTGVASALLVFLFALASCEREPTRPDTRAAALPTETPLQTGSPNIVLLTVDTLRRDHMGLYGYERSTTPAIDRFFSEGTVFQRAFANQSNTTPSIVSMLSGLLPQQHRTRILFQLLPPDLELISDQLPDHYETAAFVSNFVLTDEATGLARHFDHFDDFVDKRTHRSQLVFERRADKTADAVLE